MKPPPDSFAAAVDDFREAGRDLVHSIENHLEPASDWARALPLWVLRLATVTLAVLNLALATAGWWAQ